MLKKLKRANRGVLLAVIVLAIFAVYVNIADSQFKEKEADKVKDTVTSFCNELIDANAIMTKLSQGADEKSVESELEAAFSKVIDDHMVQSDYIDNQNIYSMSTWYETKESFEDYVKIFDEPNSENAPTEISGDVKILTIKQNGSLGATCTASITVDIKGGSGNYGMLFPVYYHHISEGTTEAYCNMHEVEFQLVKEDGEWKISGINGFLWFN